MESSEDLSITSFRIVFNNQLLEINYDPSFEEYKTVTIKSVIQKVLEKIGPQPLNTTSENYSLICSCGKAFNPEQLISKSKCDHYSYFNDPNNPSKNKNEKFLLIEKSKKEPNTKNNKNNDLLSNFEISQILMKATDAKKIKNIKAVPEIKTINFQISENLKAKIKEHQDKKEKWLKLIENLCEPKYNEQYYQEFLEMGIESNKIKASLRLTHNSKEEALLLATDANFNIENRDYLCYENSELLSNTEFMNKCKEEVKKEYPNLFDEEITTRTKMVIKAVNKKNNNDDSDELNESGEGYDSSLHDSDESDGESVVVDFDESHENSNED